MMSSPVTLVLIAINVVVSLIGFQARGSRRDDFVFIPSRVAHGRNLLGMVLSHFSHADSGHLLLNMMGLYFFGPVIETVLGAPALLLIYVGSGILATAAIFAVRRHDIGFRALGASGSVAGVLFAAIVVRPGMDLFLMFIPIPVPAPIFAVLYVALSSYFMGRQGSRICHEAHVGGALAGGLIGGLLAPGGFDPLLNRVMDLIS